MKKTKYRFKFTGLLYLCLIILFLAMFIYSLYRIIEWKHNNGENKKINEILHKYINTDSNEKFNIDFEKLEKINSDTTAYIKVNNTNIDYIVVKTDNNEFYLTHNFNKENNRSGWIFMDYSNKLDGTDKNIVIYGHNTVDKSMFGSLKYVLESKWQENTDNYNIIFATKDSLDTYRVFSTYKIDNEDYYIKTNFNSDDEYLKFLKTIKSRSNYNYNVDVDENDTIITLSTCSNNGKKRVVLHAKKVVQ